MSKGKLAGIVVACTIAIIVAIVLFTSPLAQRTNEVLEYIRYVNEQCEKATSALDELKELADKPRPLSLAWQRETEVCIQDLEHIRVELTSTRPPRRLSDKYPDTADAIHETALGFSRSITRAGYHLLDYAHAKDRGDTIGALVHLTDSTDELRIARGYQAELLLLLALVAERGAAGSFG